MMKVVLMEVLSVEAPEVAFRIYSPVMTSLNPTISEEQKREILDKVLTRGFDISLEHSDTMAIAT